MQQQFESNEPRMTVSTNRKPGLRGRRPALQVIAESRGLRRSRVDDVVDQADGDHEIVLAG